MDFFLVQQPLFKCARRNSNPRHLASENYDRILQSDVGTQILLVLHICRQNKKKPIVGCHNRLFRHFAVRLHSSGQMVVRHGGA